MTVEDIGMIVGCTVNDVGAARSATAKRTARALGAIGYVLYGIAKFARHRPSRNGRPTLIIRVEREISASLSVRSPTIDEVAAAAGCTRQTLYRRLRALGTSFEEIRADLLRRRALHLIQTERLSIKEVSYQLGFSEASAFSRAFKRWTGMCPNAARRN
jgi:AraC-like DNA-binding protein